MEQIVWIGSVVIFWVKDTIGKFVFHLGLELVSIWADTLKNLERRLMSCSMVFERSSQCGIMLLHVMICLGRRILR